MFDNDKEPSVKELIQVAENEKLFLPEFQREFVWERLQVKLLIDSLHNEYTINSILTWEGPDELARRRVGGSIKEIKIPDILNKEKITYLLDGQQRTTSLLLAFTNKPIFKRKNIKKKESLHLYYDSEYKEDDPELKFIYDDELVKINKGEIRLNQFSEKEIFQKYGTRFISLKQVYNYSKNSIDFIDIKELISDEKARFEYIQKLSKLQESILSRKIVRINQTGGLHSVLEIFSRINTLNTKLNIFDIMVAKTYKKIDDKYFDLRTYFKIINYEEGIKENYFETIEKCDIDKIQDFSLDEEDQLFLILIILKKEFKQKKILDIKTDDLLINMKYIHKTYWQVIRFLNNEFKLKKEDFGCIRPLIKFLTAYITENSSLDVEKRNFLKKWFWNTLLHNRYPGAQNEKVKNDFDVSKENSLIKSIEIYKKERSRQFNENYLDAYYGARSQLRDALSILFKFSECKDFYNGIIAVKETSSNDKLEEHHIFPLKSDKGKEIQESLKETDDSNLINNYANIAFITRETNNNRIKNKNPSEYIIAFEKEYLKLNKIDEFYKIMESQFITKEMIEDLKNDNFSIFIEKRTKLIKERIVQLTD